MIRIIRTNYYFLSLKTSTLLTVGHPEFDDKFVIQGNDEHKLKLLFENPTIRQLIETQPEISLAVKDDDGWFLSKFPKDVDQLAFEVTGVIKDVGRLKQLYDLFAETLNHLCQIGSAYEDNPGIVLK